MKASKCNHIIGVKINTCDEVQLITIKEFIEYHKQYDIMFLEHKFKHCPNCGEEIVWPEQE
jgi:uncharacterized protein YbgA (DUF1722 family)